jgi:hypothetical protein
MPGANSGVVDCQPRAMEAYHGALVVNHREMKAHPMQWRVDAHLRPR